MKETDNKTIGQEVEAYDDHHKKVRMRNISLGIMAAVVCVGVGLGLRMYGHAVTDGEVDGLVVETLADGTVSGGDAETAAVTELTYIQTSREYTVGDVTFTVSYTADAMIPDQAEMTIEETSDDTYSATFLYNDEEITPAQAVDVTAALADGGTVTVQASDLSAIVVEKAAEAETAETPEVTETALAQTDGALTYTETTKTYEDSEVKITVTYTADAKIPDQAQLKARKLNGNELTEYIESTQAELPDGTQVIEALTTAYDITFEYNGTELEPEDTVGVTMTFKDGTYDDVDDMTVVHFGEDQTDVFEDVVVEDGEASVDLGSFSVTTWTVTGKDISKYITEVSFQELDSASQFVDVDDNKVYEATESARLAFSFENVGLKDSKGDLIKTAYVKLDGNLLDYIEDLDADDVTCRFNNAGYDGEAGNFTIVKDSSGNCYAVFTFDEEFLTWYKKSTTNVIKGTAGFTFEWNTEKVSTAGDSVTVTIGEKSDTVTVKKEDTSKASSYTVEKKDSSSADYNSETGEVTIHWTIKVKVENAAWTDGQIVITDTPYLGRNLTLTGWKATGDSNKPTPTNNLDYVTLEKSTTDGEYTIKLGDESGVGLYTYEIYYDSTYTAEELKNLGEVENSITWSDGNDKGKKNVTKTAVSKSGTVVNNDAYNTDGTVEWTVTVNGGPNDYYYLKEETFTDTLTEGNVLLNSAGETAKEGDISGIKIMRYKAGDKTTETDVTSSCSVTYTNGTISATLNKANDSTDDGFYTYVITYKTKNTSADESVTVPNTAKVDGDAKGESTSNVEIKKPKITKYIGTVALKNSDNQTYTIPWTVYINGGVTQNEEHTDSVYLRNSDWESIDVSNSILSLESITVTSTTGNETTTYQSGTDYEIVSEGIEALDGQDNAAGVFKIKFLKSIDADIQIDYVFAVNADSFTNEFGIKNYFDKATDGEHSITKWQETEGLNKIAIDQSLNMGLKRTFQWKVTLSPNKIVTTEDDLTIVDSLPEGLVFDQENVTIIIQSDRHYFEVTKPGYTIKEGSYKISFNEAGTEMTVSFDLANAWIGAEGNEYNGYYVKSEKITNIYIIYNSEIIEDWPDNTLSKTYRNTVKWNGYTRTCDATVTREVMGKDVTYDASTLTLSYTVIVNPDGSKLADGGLLTLTDVFEDKGKSIELSSVQLYDLGDDGQPSAPSEQGLTKVDSGANPTAYTYTFAKDPNKNTQTITAYLPDETPCALVYTYTLTGSLGEDVTFKNKATLTGNGKSYSSEKEKTVEKVTVYAETSTDNLGSVVLVKRDAKSYKTTLTGAEFTLYKWVPGEGDNTGTWESVGDPYTTKADGIAQFSGLNSNTLYRISETATPQDYGLVEGWENQYIAFANEDDEKELVTKKIDELVADAKADGNEIEDRNLQIVDLTATKTGTYRYNRWPNERGTTSIKIEKLWKDASGNETTRNNVEKLKVDLYRTVEEYEAGKTNVCAPSEVASLNGITNEDEYETYKAKAQAEGKYVGTYDILFTNGGWSLTVFNLDKFANEEATQMYQYYVVECACVPDSTNTITAVAYAIPTTDSAGTLSKDTIQVTNTLSSSYSLPETGGVGTLMERIIRWFKDLF